MKKAMLKKTAHATATLLVKARMRSLRSLNDDRGWILHGFLHRCKTGLSNDQNSTITRIFSTLALVRTTHL